MKPRAITKVDEPISARTRWTCSRCRFVHIVTKFELVRAYDPDHILKRAEERALGHNCEDYQ